MSAGDLTPFPKPDAAARVRLLRRELATAVHHHVSEIVDELQVASARAQEVAGGGALFPGGVRDLCSRLAELTGSRAAALSALMSAAARDLPKLEEQAGTSPGAVVGAEPPPAA
jgi:hypothetical protein